MIYTENNIHKIHAFMQGRTLAERFIYLVCLKQIKVCYNEEGEVINFPGRKTIARKTFYNRSRKLLGSLKDYLDSSETS